MHLHSSNRQSCIIISLPPMHHPSLSSIRRMQRRSGRKGKTLATPQEQRTCCHEGARIAKRAATMTAASRVWSPDLREDSGKSEDIGIKEQEDRCHRCFGSGCSASSLIRPRRRSPRRQESGRRLASSAEEEEEEEEAEGAARASSWVVRWSGRRHPGSAGVVGERVSEEGDLLQECVRLDPPAPASEERVS